MSDEPTQFDVPPVTPPSGTPAVPATGGVPPVSPGGPQPPDQFEPPDRRPWIIAGLLGAIALVLLLILVLSGGDDDDVASDDSTTTTASTTTSSTSSTSTSSTSTSTTSTTVAPTTTAAPTTTEAPPVTLNRNDCANAGDNPANAAPAAQKVLEAWTVGDEGCAAFLMSGPALNELFAQDGAENSFEFQGCNDSDDPEVEQACGFFTEGTGMVFDMIFSETEGWQVIDVEFIAD